MNHPTPHPIKPGQESVWDYPRPPALERVEGELKITHQGAIIAQTTRGYRVLETSHPPVYYFPPDDCDARHVITSTHAGTSFCEWKGSASYVDVRVGAEVLSKVGWRYNTPSARFTDIAGFIAFYAAPFNQCMVRGEVAQAQPGQFYGGWVTQDIVGPFKGEPGSWGW